MTEYCSAMHFIGRHPASLLIFWSENMPSSAGLTISMSGFWRQSAEPSCAISAISSIWIFSVVSRPSTDSNPLRMMTDGSATAIFMDVLIANNRFCARAPRSAARTGCPRCGCGKPDPLRRRICRTARC